jgi:hypothetical protein
VEFGSAGLNKKNHPKAKGTQPTSQPQKVIAGSGGLREKLRAGYVNRATYEKQIRNGKAIAGKRAAAFFPFWIILSIYVLSMVAFCFDWQNSLKQEDSVHFCGRLCYKSPQTVHASISPVVAIKPQMVVCGHG